MDDPRSRALHPQELTLFRPVGSSSAFPASLRVSSKKYMWEAEIASACCWCSHRRLPRTPQVDGKGPVPALHKPAKEASCIKDIIEQHCPLSNTIVFTRCRLGFPCLPFTQHSDQEGAKRACLFFLLSTLSINFRQQLHPSAWSVHRGCPWHWAPAWPQSRRWCYPGMCWGFVGEQCRWKQVTPSSNCHARLS